MEDYSVKIKKYDSNHIQIKVYSYINKTGEKVTPSDIEYIEDCAEICSDLSEIEKNIKRSIKNSKNRAINKIYDYARSNTWEYFITLTFDPKKVDSFNYDECSKRVSKWIKNIKYLYSPDLVYIVIPELHKSGRYHFHGLFKNIGSLPLEDSGIRDSFGCPIYNIKCYKNGFTTASRIKDTKKASSYIGKYVTKELSGHLKGKKHYWISRNINKPIERNLSLNEFINAGFTRKILDNSADFKKTLDFNIDCFERKIEIYEITDTALLGQTNDFFQET